MTCKVCQSEMTTQVVTDNTIIWKCPFNHRYIEHPNRKPYPHNMERK